MSGVGKEWQIKALPNKLQHIRALTLKQGNWLGFSQDPYRSYELPYIDRRGKFTGCTLYKACLTQQSFLATTISTIARRLHCWTRGHGSKINNRSRKYLEDLITRSSTIYAITKNSYMMDRLLVLFKDFERHKKSIAGILAHFASKLDANKGFIYSQACKHAHWLTSRAQRPRDKSRPELHSYPLREVGVSNFSQRKEFIYDAISAVAVATSKIGSNIMTRLSFT